MKCPDCKTKMDQDGAGYQCPRLRQAQVAEEEVMGKWIRVTDQLPDDDITVLIHQPDSVCPVWIGFLDADKWRDLNGVLLTLPVTHWQHLPDPPEPEVADPEDTLP